MRRFWSGGSVLAMSCLMAGVSSSRAPLGRLIDGVRGGTRTRRLHSDVFFFTSRPQQNRLG